VCTHQYSSKLAKCPHAAAKLKECFTISETIPYIILEREDRVVFYCMLIPLTFLYPLYCIS
jgi:hypothetical protein